MEKLLLHETENQSQMKFLSQTSTIEDYNQDDVENYLQTIKLTSFAKTYDISKPPANKFRSEPKLCLKPGHEIYRKIQINHTNAGVTQIILDRKNGHREWQNKS